MIRHSLSEISARARAELRINPTITTYIMVGGVEQRRYAHPYARVNYGIRSITDRIAELTMGFKDFSEQVDKIVAPLADLDLGRQR